MKTLIVLALVALCVAEPPSPNKDNQASETKDKRGAVTYGTTAEYSHGIAAGASPAHLAVPAAPVGLHGLGLASPYVLQGHNLGGLGYLGGLGGLHSPIGLSGLSGLSGISGLALGAQPALLAGGYGLGHGAAYGLGNIGAYSSIPSYSLSGLAGISGLHHGHGLSLSAPVASSIKLAPSSLSTTYGVPESLPSSTYLSPPSKTYGVPSISSHSSHGSFTPITSSSYSSPSTSYGVPSVSYSAPSTSYGPPSSNYGPPSASYSSPSTSYGPPSTSDSYNTISYSGSRDYRSSH